MTMAIGFLAAPEPVWVWPVSHEQQIVRQFDAPNSPWGAGHRGIDLAARTGDDVIAPVTGVVYFSGSVVDRGVLTIKTASGQLVTLEPVDAQVTSGRVRAGQTVGTVSSGHCTGGCLHIGLRVDGEYRSPARELGMSSRAVLRPLH